MRDILAATLPALEFGTGLPLKEMIGPCSQLKTGVALL